MKISKKLTAVLVALGVMGMGVMAHAAPPVGKTVLQTYSCKRVNDCYTGLGTGKTGWIAAHDDLIRLYEIRSDGWVRGDYPAGSGRVTRWFRFGDLVMNGNFQNYEANLVNVKTAPVYRTHNSGSSFGTVYNTDKVIVVDEYGSRKCIVYNLDAGGYKMGWVDGNKVAKVSRIPTNVTNNLITPVSVLRVERKKWKGLIGKKVANINNASCYYLGTREGVQSNGPNKTMFKKSYRDDTSPYKYHPTNCTWYAWGRMKEVNDGFEIQFRDGAPAGKWGDLTTNCRVQGSIASKSVAERPGHVAFVEFYDPEEQQVYFTECNWSGRPDYAVQCVSFAEFENPYGKYRFQRYLIRK